VKQLPAGPLGKVSAVDLAALFHSSGETDAPAK
jgi:hypothetical protein